MKLTKLELSGFKSFADTVTLTFEEGVTAIVGPNGCGKSNVSDAVRWVLGEQSARLLRGGKMEDVIFQGSAARRPVNVTEVSLYLDNSDGDLPIAYREVVVTRRLSRSGQSDYLLNGSPVRLRDIQDLLRGTGLGSDAGRGDRGQDDRPAAVRPRRRAPLAVRGGGGHRALSRPEAQHRAAAGGDRRRSPAGRGPDRRGAVADPQPGPAAGQGRAARQAHRGEVRGAADPGAAAARAADATRPRAWRRASPSWPSCCPRRASALADGEQRREEAARGRGPPPRASAPRSPGGSPTVRVELGKLDGRPRRWRPSGWPTPRRRRAAGGGRAVADAAPGPAGRRRAGGRRRAIAMPPAASTSGSGPSWPVAPTPRRTCAAASAEQRSAGPRAGAGAAARRPRPSARSRASARRSRASSPRCASGRPRPRPIAPRSRSSWPAPSAGATTRSSGPAS